MGFISDALEEDASFQFDADVMPGAESVTVTPKGGTARAVTAQVNRDPPEVIGAEGVVKKPKALFAFRNHVSAGVLMSEVKTGLTVTYSVRAGETATAHLASLSTTQESDGAVIWIEV